MVVTLRIRWGASMQSYEQRQKATPKNRALISVNHSAIPQCPSKPRAANYSYKKCGSSYSHRMSEEDLESFCVCYADSFASDYISYMSDPRFFAPSGKKSGGAAYRDCKKKGYPTPH